MKNVTVVGLGYVGLPTAVHAAESGYRVSGVDLDSVKINSLKKGKSFIEDIDDERLSALLLNKSLSLFNEIQEISKTDVYLVCVPTPLSQDRKPDLSFLRDACLAIAKALKSGALVIIESTVEPGTVRNFVVPILIKESNLTSKDILVAYSPERIDPGNHEWDISNVTKLVAGFNTQALGVAVEFYNQFVTNLFVCSSLEIAETAKLLENSFRLINISFINEIAMFCKRLGIEINEVIAAAATKPYGFMPFYPSVGVGGHCIPVDPLYLSNKARELGAPTNFIDLADQINQEMPDYFVDRAEEKLNGLKNKNILVVGVAYKPNVADVRETPAVALISGLRNKGAQVSWHDDLVKEWNGEKSVDLKPGFDLAIVASPHAYLDLKKLGDTLVLDTRGSI